MKANNLQIAICKLIKEQADFWMSSNDITSPTHLCDIDETITAELDDMVSDEEKEAISQELCNLYVMVTRFNEYKESDSSVAPIESVEEKPLKFVGKGDIVAFYEEWKGEKKRCVMLVRSYDYGNGDMTVSDKHPYGASAPRCIWGLHCTGTWYGDWAPSTHEFYKATEEEKQRLIDEMPEYVRARATELKLI